MTCNDLELGSGARKLNLTNLLDPICGAIEYKEIPAWTNENDHEDHLLGTARNLIWDLRDGEDKIVQNKDSHHSAKDHLTCFFIVGAINLVKTDPWTPNVEDCRSMIENIVGEKWSAQ